MGATNALPVVILCGGLGTRLRSVLPDRPKCLAPINGRPFLELLLSGLNSDGFKRVVLCLGYRSGEVEEFIRSRDPWQMDVMFSVEREALGTAGAVKNAEPLTGSADFVVMNGDTILELDFKRLIETHREREALATLALWRSRRGTNRYGSVGLDSAGRITGFYEKAQGTGSSLINGGVYVFSRQMFAHLPSAPPRASLETQVFPSLVGKGLCGMPCEGYFLDIGVPEDYQRAQVELARRF
ncbi:MAG: nucleotidyltransferase family protein [Terriglobia bacterium]